MYWKVRKLTLKDMLMQNLTKLILVFSVFLNVLLIATHPSPNKGLTKDLAANYKAFAKQVTQHLLDTSYVSYRQSTAELLSGELDHAVIEGMKQRELLAKSADEVDATYKKLFDNRQLSAVQIKDVAVGTPPPGKPIPVEVRGMVAVHAADSGITNPVPFHFHYDMALRMGDDKKTPLLGEDKKPLPVVVGFREVTDAEAPPAQSDQQ
jgi:hypothetical protein